MRITIFQVKLVHTIIFWVLSGCVVYTLVSALLNRITLWTWIAAGLLLVESVVLAMAGWVCPLTLLAERQGAVRGSVADLFLPRRLADHIFPVCGTTYALSLVIIAYRVLSR